MLAEGKYTARGVEAALCASKDKGTPSVQVVVEITEGPDAGHRLRWDGWLTDLTAQRTMESLRYLGWTGTLLTDLAGIDANLVQIVVEHEANEKDGKSYPRVQWINKLGGGAKIHDDAKMGDAAAKQLAQRFQALARGVPVSGGKPAASSTKPTNGKPAGRDPLAGADMGPDDDVPFRQPYTTDV
jgi:hypothetical protein